MTISAEQLDLIRPRIFEGEPKIDAWFTLKNARKVNKNAPIAGLNLGSDAGSIDPSVEQNRELLFQALDLNSDQVAFAQQVHGTRLQTVSGSGIYPETDGMVTQVPGLALAIQVADCAAVLLAEPAACTVAAVHAGWRGAAGGILPKAVVRMKELGSDPADIRAFVSPCISLKHFEVGEEVAEQFPDAFIDRVRFDKPHVNLKSFLRHQLIGEGIVEEQIELDEGCTIEDSGRFYSYRREKEQSGRMLGLIRLNRG